MLSEIITSETGISIGLVISLLGLAFWLGKLWSGFKDHLRDDYARHARIDAQLASRAEAVDRRLEQLEAENKSVIERLARIETKLDLILEKK